MIDLVILTGILAGTETIAMTALTEYSKNSNMKHLLLGVFIYGFAIPYLILKSLNFKGIGTVNCMWNIITTVAMVAIGSYMFNDNVNRLHLVSLVFGVASIICLYCEDPS